MLTLLLTLYLCKAFAVLPVADSLPKKFHKYDTKIVTSTEGKQTGFLYHINDSTLQLTAVMVSGKTAPSGKLLVQEYKYTDINTVKLKRHNSVGRGALFGGLIGIGTGIAAGLFEGDDPAEYWFGLTAGEKALGYGFSLGIAGAIVGLIVGAVVHKKFTINGNREKFQAMKSNLLHRANETPSK